MKTHADNLDPLKLAYNCPAEWQDMEGDDRVRYCRLCHLNVYNISAMKREEAAELVRNHEGRLCVTFFRRADGTVLTRDCPVGLRMARRGLAKIGVAVAAMIAITLQLLVVLVRRDSNSEREGQALLDRAKTELMEASAPARPSISKDHLEQLRSLGYVGTN